MVTNHKIRKIYTFDNIEFWLVSGNIVHNIFDPNWKNDTGKGEFIGGHHYVFKYIPENEIWISNLDKETYSTAVHEYTERIIMKEQKLNYEDAHIIATNVENMYDRLCGISIGQSPEG